MRRLVLASAILLTACATHQAIISSPSSPHPDKSLAQPAGASTHASLPADSSVKGASTAPTRPLPFKGRLADGDPAELPPSVALSLSRDSVVVFSYREELTHDEYHIPLWFSAIDPVTYFGSPLGDYGVTAFASLSIADGDRIVGDYTAKVHVSKTYNLYSEPTHQELEREARIAVRERIDKKINQDASRIAQELSSNNTSAKAADGQ
jgi:hypothetical protein